MEALKKQIKVFFFYVKIRRGSIVQTQFSEIWDGVGAGLISIICNSKYMRGSGSFFY